MIEPIRPEEKEAFNLTLLAGQAGQLGIVVTETEGGRRAVVVFLNVPTVDPESGEITGRQPIPVAELFSKETPDRYRYPFEEAEA